MLSVKRFSLIVGFGCARQVSYERKYMEAGQFELYSRMVSKSKRKTNIMENEE